MQPKNLESVEVGKLWSAPAERSGDGGFERLRGPRTRALRPSPGSCGETSGANPKRCRTALATALQRARAGFTLIELLTVIAIIGILAAMVAPVVGNFRKGDTIAAATQQLLGDVSRARQLAIAGHSTVYMVFVPSNFMVASFTNKLSRADYRVAANLLDKQLTGYNFMTLRSIGDQPGQPHPRYLATWQTMPDQTFIPGWKFVPFSTTLVSNPVSREIYPVQGFQWVPLPVPALDASNYPFPCIAFNYLGQLVSNNVPLLYDEYIPVAHGSVGVPRALDKEALPGPVTTTENPPSNSILSFNLIHIDRFTGRARLEHQQVQ